MSRVLRVLAVLTVRLVLAVGGVRGEVLLNGQAVVRRLTVVVLVVVAAVAAAATAASGSGGVLIGAGSPGLLAGIAGHTHQTCRWEKHSTYTLRLTWTKHGETCWNRKSSPFTFPVGASVFLFWSDESRSTSQTRHSKEPEKGFLRPKETSRNTREQHRGY